MALKQLLAACAATASLSACAIPASQAVPDEIFLLNDRLTVIFSNGVQCRVEEISQNLAGDLSGCPVPAQYRVTIDRPSYLGNVVTEPYAEVSLTTSDGKTYQFKRPRLRQDDDND
ncbi:hypothetical protein FQV27_07580 [Paracoccus aurantiacus]|uniref:Lipoprotein n=1 Tax=Paracoccus aurantiacus TaxID=2599412 RepID=A0A5C6S6K1_9RHOB|nr:hypothetical protein [Paracoccus aurantiacus]TXB69957.1 hypothetical protein FQV27_07580 [Paracoccus aurantiacus]